MNVNQHPWKPRMISQVGPVQKWTIADPSNGKRSVVWTDRDGNWLEGQENHPHVVEYMRAENEALAAYCADANQIGMAAAMVAHPNVR